MLFELTETTAPRLMLLAAFTIQHVWYSRGASLYRRNLLTLKETFQYEFPSTITFLWSDATRCVVTTEEPSRAWECHGRECDIPWDLCYDNTHSSGRYWTRAYKNSLCIECDSRARERVKKLVKDEALAARVCHYL